MGRNKIHKDDKARKRFHREKKKQMRLANKAGKIDKDEMLRVQEQWMKRQTRQWVFAPISDHDDDQRKGRLYKEKRALFLCKNPRSQKFYVVERASYYQRNKPRVSDAISTLEEAQHLVSRVEKEQDAGPAWADVQTYYPEAKGILLDYDRKKPINFKGEIRLGLILAVADLWTLGFEGFKARKGHVKSSPETRTRRGTILDAVGNIPIVNEQKDLITTGEVITDGLLYFKPTAKEGYMIMLFYCAIDAFEVCSLIGLLNQFHLAKADIQKNFHDTLAANIRSSSNPKGHILRKDNHPYLKVPEIRDLLTVMYEEGVNDYLFGLLSLSTGLRPEEIRRLLEPLPGEKERETKERHRKYFDGLEFNYKGEGLQPDQYLVQKTDGSIDVSKLTNPKVSLVARLILRNFDPKLTRPKFFHKRADKKVGYVDRYPGLARFYERCLRTTAATHMAYCNKCLLPEHRATHADVQIHLAHKDQTMALTTYANNSPYSGPPEKYFGVTEVVIELDGKEYQVSKGENLWNIFLLDDFVRRMLYDIPEREQREFKKMVIREYELTEIKEADHYRKANRY